MAGCDYLTGNSKQWEELKIFFKRNKPDNINYMLQKPRKGECRIYYIADEQGWISKKCHLPWVQRKLKSCFMIQTIICGEPHHLRESEK